MRIYLDGNWYTLPSKILIIELDEEDKANIAKMGKGYSLYCKYDEEVFQEEYIKQILRRLKNEK